MQCSVYDRIRTTPSKGGLEARQGPDLDLENATNLLEGMKRFEEATLWMAKLQMRTEKERRKETGDDGRW